MVTALPERLAAKASISAPHCQTPLASSRFTGFQTCCELIGKPLFGGRRFASTRLNAERRRAGWGGACSATAITPEKNSRRSGLERIGDGAFGRHAAAQSRRTVSIGAQLPLTLPCQRKSARWPAEILRRACCGRECGHRYCDSGRPGGNGPPRGDSAQLPLDRSFATDWPPSGLNYVLYAEPHDGLVTGSDFSDSFSDCCATVPRPGRLHPPQTQFSILVFFRFRNRCLKFAAHKTKTAPGRNGSRSCVVLLGEKSSTA